MMMQMNAGGKALVMGTPHQWSLAQSLVQPNNLSTTPSAMNLVGTYPRNIIMDRTTHVGSSIPNLCDVE